MATTTGFYSAVNDVISVCKDAQEGFQSAANAVNDPTLKNIFEEYSKQRAKFGQELQMAVKDQGAEPENPSGTAGKLHSAWIALKGVVTGHSEHQILIETERGEDLSVERYKEALGRQDLPAQLRSVLEEQYQDVQLAHKHIRGLRDHTG